MPDRYGFVIFRLSNLSFRSNQNHAVIVVLICPVRKEDNSNTNKRLRILLSLLLFMRSLLCVLCKSIQRFIYDKAQYNRI